LDEGRHNQREAQQCTSSVDQEGEQALKRALRIVDQIVRDALAAHAKEPQARYVQVEFTVAADGSVQDARIVGRDANDQDAQEILHAVREARFRPKFVDGQPVAAPGITYREGFWTDTSRK
jgi:TonB family protein